MAPVELAHSVISSEQHVPRVAKLSIHGQTPKMESVDRRTLESIDSKHSAKRRKVHLASLQIANEYTDAASYPLQVSSGIRSLHVHADANVNSSRPLSEGTQGGAESTTITGSELDSHLRKIQFQGALPVKKLTQGGYSPITRNITEVQNEYISRNRKRSFNASNLGAAKKTLIKKIVSHQNHETVGHQRQKTNSFYIENFGIDEVATSPVGNFCVLSCQVLCSF